jgi:hypothetical integral membrane protein (TIGR02206 family)
MTTHAPISAALHLEMVVFVCAVVVAVVALGTWAKRRGRLAGLSKTLGTIMIGVTVVYNTYYFLPSNFRWDTSLPLHVCDILGLIAAVALIVPRRMMHAVLYFTAIPLAGQAILTPTGNQEPGILRFWLYWILHAGIIATSVYDLIVRNYRPALRDYALILLLDLAYILFITPINVLFGWNYGYLGDAKPDRITAIDFLGPWPQRIIVLLFLVAVVQAIMIVPWLIRSRERER